MSELIERVARAIYAARYDGPYQAVPWVEKAAHAVLVALRDPPESMTEHASYVHGEWSRRNIEAFIDAALSDDEVSAAIEEQRK